MAKLAVDVVLLPPKHIRAKAIVFNQKFGTKGGQRIILSESGSLPHISLAMGVLDERDLPKVSGILTDLANKFLPLPLAIDRVDFDRGFGFAIQKTGDLQHLHESVMKVMGKFFSYNITEAMFHGSTKISRGSINWVKDYPTKASLQHFFPHITLGYSKQKSSVSFSTKFSAAELALCHLGNHCTCRKVLWSNK